MSLFSLFRKRPKAAPVVVIHIDEHCVVRPGDVVLIPQSRVVSPPSAAAAVGQKAVAKIKAMCPDAQVYFVPSDEGQGPLNLTSLLKQLVSQRPGNAADDGSPEPFPLGSAANCAQGSGQQGVTPTAEDVASSVVLDHGRAPEPVVEPLPGSAS